ncbi:hypothetical protein CVT25_000046 [Psilocybe cyanescens]|uniref:NADP-dependent oxidoreductase domain-containing protein n=1 Tax=Psilocybe cyanescens TaxID=93625 RepID=A0A409X8G7_PSICY|nr:hypothetical protein CVT25_000046 [Psilocybe cyanescens]
MDANMKIRLNNGLKVPLLATGSYAPKDAQGAVKGWILSALQARRLSLADDFTTKIDKRNVYRMDSAISILLGYMVRTEKVVGEAIKESNIPREELFITTKLAWNHHHRVRESFEESLANLDTGYIDLYLLHAPPAVAHDVNNTRPKNPDGTIKLATNVTFNDSWAHMEKLLDTGKVKAIGVSNFSVKTLEKLSTTAKIMPAVNQIELHPYLAQNGLRDYCNRKGITLMAYTPSGYDGVRSDPLIVSLAEKYKVTPTQIILAWHISRQSVVVPTSKNNKRQKENLSIPILSEEDLAKVWDLDRGQRISVGPDPETGHVLGWTLEQLGWESYHPKYA